MARTYCEAEFSVIDTTAKSDGAVSVDSEQPLSDAQDLTKDEITPPAIATLELNRWVLGQPLSIYDPDDTSAEYGWWSLDQCGADGVFADAPTLTVTFSEHHTAIGLTLQFSGDAWPTDITVRWYGDSGVLLESADFSPDGLLYFCEKQVVDFREIGISFHKMSLPFRYLKLERILYGQVLLFGGGDLTAASMQEEANPISAELPINTVSLTVHSNNDAFSIVNPSGIYKSLQQRQPILVREVVDGETKEMGTYYLDEWENESDNVTTLKAIDAIGLLDALPFVGGQWANELVPAILRDIFDGCSIPYVLAEQYSSTALSGRVDACTKREALQQVAFAIGAIVGTNRTEMVYLTAPDYAAASTITKSRKWAEQTLTLRPLVTGVEVTAHSFDAGGEDTQTVVGCYATDLPANTAVNIVRITDATMVSPEIAGAVAKRVYEYYQLRHKNTVTIKTETERAGQAVSIESYYNKTITGIVESMEIDLAGGYISTLEVVGGVGE